MSGASMLDAALSPSPYSELAVAVKRWAEVERDVIEANQTAGLNRRLPEIASAHREASAALLAAVDALEGR